MADVPKMDFVYGAPIIDFWGPVVRIGLEGKWVQVIKRDPSMTRKTLLALIHAMDKQRTH